MVNYGSLVLPASVSDLTLVLYTISRFVVTLSGLTCQQKRETWDIFVQPVSKVCSLCIPVHIICSKTAYPYISVTLHCNYIHIPANKFLHFPVSDVADDNLNTCQLRERNNKRYLDGGSGLKECLRKWAGFNWLRVGFGGNSEHFGYCEGRNISWPSGLWRGHDRFVQNVNTATCRKKS